MMVTIGARGTRSSGLSGLIDIGQDCILGVERLLDVDFQAVFEGDDLGQRRLDDGIDGGRRCGAVIAQLEKQLDRAYAERFGKRADGDRQLQLQVAQRGAWPAVACPCAACDRGWGGRRQGFSACRRRPRRLRPSGPCVLRRVCCGPPCVYRGRRRRWAFCPPCLLPSSSSSTNGTSPGAAGRAHAHLRDEWAWCRRVALA